LALTIGTIGARPLIVGGGSPEMLRGSGRHIVMPFIPRNADNVGIL
jgi:hypothetical protein